MTTQINHDIDSTVMRRLLAHGAQSTQRMYCKAWRQFSAWARSFGLPHAPATAETLGAYLSHLAGSGLALATVRAARAAVVTAHRLLGWPPPEGRAVDRGIRAAALQGRAPQRARPLRAWDVQAIRARVGVKAQESARAAHRARVDAALVQVMREALLRPWEAAQLTWGDLDSGPDGGMQLRVCRAGVGWGVDTVSLSAVATWGLEAIRPWKCRPEVSVFRLPPYAIARRIRRAAAEAGLDDGFTGDSPREGGLDDLVADGADLREIMVRARWRTMGRHTLRVQALDGLAAARA